jgi:peroxiredoxin
MTSRVDLEPAAVERLAAQLAASKVLTLQGTTVRMRDLWRDGTTVTSFVRHFGCLFCHQMVHDLVTTVPEILKRGATVIIVGNGTIEQARYFFSAKQLPRAGVAVVTDPDRESFKAAGLERSLLRTFNRDAAGAFGSAFAQGHRVTGLFGDLTQLGGLLVVKPPSTPTYLHRSKFAGDHPNMAEVVATIG